MFNFTTQKLLATGILLFLGFNGNAQESRFKNLKQLTSGGDNAEAYFSPDSKSLTFQVNHPEKGIQCDQIYVFDLDQDLFVLEQSRRISTGLGRTTCSFFMPDGQHILYSSTHLSNEECPTPPAPDPKGRYLWPIYPEYDIFMADLEGNIVQQMTDTYGYDAEAVLSPDGTMIAFTSTRSGDIDIWIMNADGSQPRQVTTKIGYEGGAFFSHDSKKLVFRANYPQTPEAIKEYQDLLSQNLVAPNNMELYTINIDGTDLKQITNLGKANWAPYFHPSDEKIIFASNHHSTRGYDFQLFMIDIDGQNLEQITWGSHFNAFPMFSPDGKKIVFSSNRNPEDPRETNVYIADWVELDPAERSNKQALKKHISFLASDELEGRLTGSKNEQKAAHYIENILKELGLKPYKNNEYQQKFEYSLTLNHDGILKEKENTGINVIGYLDNQANKTIVIGAHYDHLGMNEHGQSTDPKGTGQIHNGADDNASGVAAVLELARMLSENETQEEANYLFAFFSGEEDGLIGSKYLAKNIKSDYPHIQAMINLDMIGRLDADKNLTIGGVGTNPNFGKIIEQYTPAGFHITIDSSGVGPSDHTSFYLKDIPVLFFFTGTHQDYHKPSDDEHLINYYGVKTITDYIFKIVRNIETFDDLEFIATKVNEGRRAPNYKVSLGIMPNYSDEGKGLKVDGVMEGRTADLAGIQAGDIITSIGNCKIENIYDYMDCLTDINVNDERVISFTRGTQTFTKKVKFM